MSNVLTDLSDAMAGTVATAGASVVRVEARRRLPATGIIWSADGVVVTANHVVKYDEVVVGLPDGKGVTATLVGRDPSTDLAILRADATGLQALTEVNKQNLGVGNLVLALGRPGHTVQATLGIVSALGESWRTGRGGMIDRYVQTDVTMYPGFSGGPLVTAAGQLVGLNTSALARGVSLTLPTATIARVTDALLAHGRIRRGYLGVSTQRAKLPDAARAELSQKRGLLVVSVENGSPAEAGGLTLGDTIVSLDGASVENHHELLAVLTDDKIDTAVSVQIVRGGQVQTIDVTIGERP